MERIGYYPPIHGVPVDTAWDLGVSNATAIWFFQRCGDTIRYVDYLEDYGKGVAEYAKSLEAKTRMYGWDYGDHWAPHDIRVRDWSTGRSRLETAIELGIHFRIAPQLSLEDGIQACRVLWPRCIFHEPACRPGLDALASYQYEEDEDKSAPHKKHFKPRPLHDWSSNGADAFRMASVAIRDAIEQVRDVEPRWDYSFDEQIEALERKRMGYG